MALPRGHVDIAQLVVSGASYQIENPSLIQAQETVYGKRIDSLGLEVRRRWAPLHRTRKVVHQVRDDLTPEGIDPPSEVWRDLPAD
jgi:hypothetical protein